MLPTSSIQGNKWDTINGQNIPIQTKKHECNSKPDKYKDSLIIICQFILKYIYIIYSLYIHIPYIDTLYLI